jgi:hypothetical protein
MRQNVKSLHSIADCDSGMRKTGSSVRHIFDLGGSEARIIRDEGLDLRNSRADMVIMFV